MQIGFFTLVLAFALGAALNSLVWSLLAMGVRLFFYFKDKPLREQMRKEQEAFERLMMGRIAQASSEGESVN